MSRKRAFRLGNMPLEEQREHPRVDDYESYLRNEKARVIRQKIRHDMIVCYGGRCACCGESNEAFLTIHHINGNGNQHRKEGRSKVFEQITQEADRSKYLLLCFNCHSAGHTIEGCPHPNGVKLWEMRP